MNKHMNPTGLRLRQSEEEKDEWEVIVYGEDGEVDEFAGTKAEALGYAAGVLIFVMAAENIPFRETVLEVAHDVSCMILGN